MTIAGNIETILVKSSWIRKMFEEGGRLKAQHGPGNVYDFSLGNPNLPPPDRFKDALQETVADCGSGDHGYMPNVGYPRVRRSIAGHLSTEQQISISVDEVIMTCGAAGGLNVVLKTILNPGDEILTPIPCFVEYGFYAANHGGILKTVPTNSDFTLDLDAIEKAITPKTKGMIINSPNNPTGQVYSEESLKKLGALLAEKGRQTGRTIYLISDEPYRKIVFDGKSVPSVLNAYPESMVVTSYSKDLSIPGERLGYIAVNPKAAFREQLLAGMALCNRILGFVNAPALMQRVVARLQGESVDIGAYARKRDLLCDDLADCGYKFIKPAGAFYLFPETPIDDDVKFVQALQEEMILAVPGSGFKCPGHFRIAFCVDDATITGSIPGFRRVMEKFIKKETK